MGNRPTLCLVRIGGTIHKIYVYRVEKLQGTELYFDECRLDASDTMPKSKSPRLMNSPKPNATTSSIVI